jgi:5'-nucleotidase
VSLILLTNDDGIEAEGLASLEQCVKGLADLIVVAPDRERSAVSHGLTIHSPLVLKQLEPHRYTLNGTPADCVVYAITHILSIPPDLVVSGINHGANLGDDIMYSGTVAAAREASRHGIPSLALSQAYDEMPIRFRDGAKFIHALVQTMLEGRANGGICLNVNIPTRRPRGAKITRQGCSAHFPHFSTVDRREKTDPLVDRSARVCNTEIPLDYHAILDHYISITPLQRDQTDYETAQELIEEAPRLFDRLRIPGIGLIGYRN